MSHNPENHPEDYRSFCPKLKQYFENGTDEEMNEIIGFTKEKVIGCLLGLAVGDAKGMPAESKSIAEADIVADTFDYIPGYLPAGHYTDDTHHAILLAESMLQEEGFNPRTFLKTLCSLDLKRGIGPTTYKALQKFLAGDDPESTGSYTETNGSAMRIAPIAILYHYDMTALREAVIESTVVTHKSNVSVAGALTIAFAIAYMLNHDGDVVDEEMFLSELSEFVKPYSPELSEMLEGKCQLPPRVGCGVVESVPHAIHSFLKSPNNYQDVVADAIRGAGDADTVAAMAGAVAGALNGFKNIPPDWINGLENNEKGRDYIIAIAEKLYELSLKKEEKFTNLQNE